MRENFTLKNLMSFMMSMAFICLASNMSGQLVNTVTITAPASIEGDYSVLIATFGAQQTLPLMEVGALLDDGTAPVNDGCEPGASNVNAKLAFIDRGDCEFGTKALFAENAGATAVIICNNGGDFIAPGPGDDGANVNISVYMMDTEDCEKIKVELANGDVDATLQYKCVPPAYGPEVIWGRNTGEGDFADGLPADWSIERPTGLDPAVETWFWEPSGTATGFFTNFTISSATQCNGAMVMSSDLLDNDNTSNLGSGPCPGPCTSSLVSPVIDISGADPSKGFFLQFTQAFRQFTSSYNIILSKNGGASWPDTLSLNSDAVVNSPNINETIKIPLEGYIGVQNLQFKFEYVGNYYYWVIDDVALTNESYVDMQVNSNWYAAPPSWKVPASQVSEMPFLIDIFNNGNVDAQNVEVRVDIYDESGTQIEALTKNYGTVPVYSINENNAFGANDTWLPPSTPGTYTGYYVISAESGDPDVSPNLNEGNDSIQFELVVTEDVFSNAQSEADGNTSVQSFTGNSTWGNPSNDAFTAAMAVGSAYYMPNGSNYTVKSLKFGVTDEDIAQSGFVHVRMYKWLGSPDSDYIMDTDERDLVGANTLIVDTLIANGISDSRAINIPIFSVNSAGNPVPGESVDLDDNSLYVVMLLCQPLTAGIQSIDLIGANNTNGVDRNYNTFATNMAFDSTGVDRNAGTYVEAMTTGTTSEFDGIGPDFWSIMTLWTELAITPNTGTEDLNDNLSLVAFPNPASDLLTVNVGLEKVSAIDIELLNLEGKRIQHNTFGPVQVGSIVLNISDVPNGVYILNVRTEEGMKSQKIVVQK